MLSKVLKISIRSLVGVVSSQTKRLYTDRQIEKIGQKQSNQRREIDLNNVQLKLTFLSEDKLHIKQLLSFAGSCVFTIGFPVY